MLKYPVYVRSVTNLSDARYCAGMGVEMIGFCLDSSKEEFVELPVFHGIAGWISGVKIVAEFDNYPSPEAIKDLSADFCSTSAEYTPGHLDIGMPVIYKIEMEEIPEIMPPKESYILLLSTIADSLENHSLFIKNISKDHKVILGFGFDSQTIDTIYQSYQPYGFSLKGGNEIAPGLKTFDELAEILEAIEI